MRAWKTHHPLRTGHVESWLAHSAHAVVKCRQSMSRASVTVAVVVAVVTAMVVPDADAAPDAPDAPDVPDARRHTEQCGLLVAAWYDGGGAWVVVV